MDGDGKNLFPPPVDFCKMSPIERQKVKDAWLAVPRSYQPPTVGTPTLVRRTPFGLSVPALKAKCSPHTELLAVARNGLPQMHFMTSAEREVQKELEEEMTKEELKWLKKKYCPPAPTGVKKSALKAKITPRVETMALARLCKPEENYKDSKKRYRRKRSVPSHFPLPEKSPFARPRTPRVCGCAESVKRKLLTSEGILNETRKKYFSKLSDMQRKSVIKKIGEHYNVFHTNYPPEADKIYVIEDGSIIHARCTGRLPEKGKRVRYICELNKAQRKGFRRRMKLLGLPKKAILPDGGPDRGPKKKLKEFEPWITMMSQPRYNVLSEIPYNPFKVSSAAKLYTPTERVLILAKPREPMQPPPMTDFEGNELPPRREWSWNSRRRIIASPRTLELATPKFVKKKAADDVKEDPFAVPRRALTAYCTPRTAELAEPRRR